MSAAREISINAVQFHLWEIPGNENKSKVQNEISDFLVLGGGFGEKGRGRERLG